MPRRQSRLPVELLAAGRAEVSGYGGEFRPGTVTAVERRPDGEFRVALDDGSAALAARAVTPA